MAGNIGPAAVPVTATAQNHLSISKLFLPESQRFNGKNLEAFKQNFSLLLSTVDLEYLIDDNVFAPTAAVLARDNSILFRNLFANVGEDAQAIVLERQDEGGKKAWAHLLAFYGKKDVGTTIAKFKEYMACTWEGGDVDSFQAFITRKSTLRSELQQRKYKITDDSYASHIICSAPINYIPLNGSIDLTDLSKLKSDDLVPAITSSISIYSLQPGNAVLYASAVPQSKEAQVKRPYPNVATAKPKASARVVSITSKEIAGRRHESKSETELQLSRTSQHYRSMQTNTVSLRSTHPSETPKTATQHRSHGNIWTVQR